jgi:D-ribose pyranose/furanose isomerase RbsD
MTMREHLEDGLYATMRQGKKKPTGHIFVQDGILYLPSAVLPVIVLMTCGKPMMVVTHPSGREECFIRALHVAEEMPKYEPMIRKMAEEKGVSM